MLRFAAEQYQCQEWYLANNDARDAGYSSGHTMPYWLDSIERPKFPKLTENKKCDFLVVGAGIGTLKCINSFSKFWHVFHLAGITTAYHLAVRDPSKQVILIDDGENLFRWNWSYYSLSADWMRWSLLCHRPHVRRQCCRTGLSI